MKTFEPVKVCNYGKEVDATIFNMICMNDNLKDSAAFNYQLMIDGGNQYMPIMTSSLVSGQLIMTGSDYDAWDTNDYAYDWAAKQLNLVITGEYVPPTPPVPPTPVEPTTTTTTTVSE